MDNFRQKRMTLVVFSNFDEKNSKLQGISLVIISPPEVKMQPTIHSFIIPSQYLQKLVSRYDYVINNIRIFNENN
jgi:hypothetical protein